MGFLKKWFGLHINKPKPNEEKTETNEEAGQSRKLRKRIGGYMPPHAFQWVDRVDVVFDHSTLGVDFGIESGAVIWSTSDPKHVERIRDCCGNYIRGESKYWMCLPQFELVLYEEGRAQISFGLIVPCTLRTHQGDKELLGYLALETLLDELGCPYPLMEARRFEELYRKREEEEKRRLGEQS